MAGPEMPRRSLERAVARVPRSVAIALSVAVHAALLLALSRMSWEAGEPAAATQRRVVWLRDALPPPAPATGEEATVAVAADGALPAALPLERLAPLEPVPLAPRAEPLPLRGGDSVPQPTAAPIPPVPSPDLPPPSSAGEERPAIALDGVDWEAERRRAIEQLTEEWERERRYHTFSLADVLDEPEAPLEEPGPARSIFEPGGGRGNARGALRPGQARTRAGRLVGELCHALTGGVGVMGLFSLCAEDNARSDLFAHLKPEYLRRRPEDFVTRRPALAEAEAAESALGASASDGSR